MASGIAVPLNNNEYDGIKFEMNWDQGRDASISVREIYEAIAKNGVEHLRGAWVKLNRQGLVVGGCILAQGALNLKTRVDGNGSDIYEALNQLGSIPADSRWFRRDYEPIGAAIVYWNDKHERKLGSDGKWRVQYHLRTWNSVLKMVWEILEPHFDKTITVRQYDY